MSGTDLAKFLGKSIDGLKLSDRWQLTGHWVAVELYSPERLPLRLIQAVGHDARSCVESLKQRGLDPELFEYQALDPPYRI